MPPLLKSTLGCFSSRVSGCAAALALLLSSVLSAASGVKAAAEQYPLQNYLTGIAQQQWAARNTQLAGIKTGADVTARADFVRQEFLRALGGLPTTGAPLQARISGTLVREGYRVEKLVFESQPGCFVTANLYVPTGAGPFPAILGAQGHSTEGKAYPTYQIAFINLALRGNIVLAFDPPGQGERFEQRNASGQMELLGHFSPGLQCILTGGNIARYFMWDAIRAVDYLLTRDDVDPKRIGVCGNSGGGTQSAFLGVLEPRIAVAAPSCYWTSWPALWAKSGPQDPEQVLHQTIKRGIDYSDVIFAFAPKPMIMLTATKDSFPIAGAHAAHTEGRPAYALLGAPESLAFFEYNDPHGWSQPRREATYAWFDRWFHGRNAPVTEVAVKTETIEALQATATGQVVTALNGKTVQMLSLEIAEQLSARRRGAPLNNRPAARSRVAARLEVPDTRKMPVIREGAARREGSYARSSFEVVPEPGIVLPTEFYVPAGPGESPRPAVILIADTDVPPSPEWARELARWMEAGYCVVVARLRGLLPPDKPGEYAYTTRYRTAMRAITVGKTMAGMRVQDLLAIYDFLANRPEVNRSDISVIGRGQMGPVALYAAMLEPGFKKVVLQDALVSFDDLTRARAVPVLWADSIVPGVLMDFDLPDLARLAGPGKVLLVNPVSLADPSAATRRARDQYAGYARVIEGAPGVSARDLQ
ncbi:MAG: hypothetical protein RIQ93_1031 [Verrucomicrobiota bacterium]|jgi:cephalosporin-C deacetylase-like acetyl esterase